MSYATVKPLSVSLRASRASQLYTLTAFVLALLAAGCGNNAPKLVSVTGTVKSPEGTPVTAGAIIFHPVASNSFQDDKPSSLLQLDGTFTMKTFPFGEGVTPGKYKVTLAPEVASRLRRLDYANVAKTPWEIEVPESGVSGQVFEVK